VKQRIPSSNLFNGQSGPAGKFGKRLGKVKGSFPETIEEGARELANISLKPSVEHFLEGTKKYLGVRYIRGD